MGVWHSDSLSRKAHRREGGSVQSPDEPSQKKNTQAVITEEIPLFVGEESERRSRDVQQTT